MHRRADVRVTCAVAVACLAAAAFAEGTKGNISGSVSAKDGSRLPGVRLALRGVEGGPVMRLATGELGTFRSPELPPGRYDLTAELRGFEPRVVSGIVVAEGAEVALDVRLDVATVSELITVVGFAPRDSLEASRIRESPARDVGEALASTPGLWKLRKGGIANEVVLRGLQSRDLNVLVDGQRIYGACPNHMDPAAFHVDFAEVERIEVGKGPFDVRNQGGLGGTVNVVTRRPEPGWHFTPALAAGSFQFVNPSATASYGGASVSALAGYSYRSAKPYEDGSGRRFTDLANYRPEARDGDAFAIATGWGRLGWSPAERHRIELAYTRQDARAVDYPYLMMDAVWDDTDRASLRYDAAGLSDRLTGLSVQAYWTRVDHWMSDERRTSALGAPRAYSMGTRARTRAVGGKAEATMRAVTVGLELYDRAWDATSEMAGRGYRPQAMVPDVSVRVAGLYAESQRALGPAWSLTAGLRLDRAWSAADEALANTGLYFAYQGTRSTSATDTLPSAKLRLRWRRGGLEVSGAVGHAGRVPEASERYLALQRMGTDWVGNPGLGPSRNTGLEAALSWEAGGFRTRLSLFLQRVAGFITVVEQPRRNMVEGVMNARARSFANVDATLRGGEASASLPLPGRLFLSADASYVRGTQDLDPARGIVSRDLPEMPPLLGRASLRFDDGRAFAVVAGMFAAGQRHVDASLGERPTPGYGVLNLYGGLRRGRLQLTAGVANLLDHAYAEPLSYQRDPFRSGATVPEPGRSLYVSVSSAF